MACVRPSIRPILDKPRPQGHGGVELGHGVFEVDHRPLVTAPVDLGGGRAAQGEDEGGGGREVGGGGAHDNRLRVARSGCDQVAPGLGLEVVAEGAEDGPLEEGEGGGDASRRGARPVARLDQLAVDQHQAAACGELDEVVAVDHAVGAGGG